jgi:hypothetical protein
MAICRQLQASITVFVLRAFEVSVSSANRASSGNRSGSCIAAPDRVAYAFWVASSYR